MPNFYVCFVGGAVSHAPLPVEEKKRRSVGPLLPNMEGRVVGEDGVDVELGLPGELWVRGPNIMKYVSLPISLDL